jgi:transcription elongation factor GreA-like protein
MNENISTLHKTWVKILKSIISERQNLTKRLIALISNDVEVFLQPESKIK